MRQKKALFFLPLALICLFLLPFGFVQKTRRLFSRCLVSYGKVSFEASDSELDRENKFLRRLVDDLSEELLKQKALSTHFPQERLLFLPAHVICRDPALWSSFLWIDVGLEANEQLGKEVVAKNSPVVSGSCLVGIVEQVERKRALVRLITDEQLISSVRVVPKGETSLRISVAASLLSRALLMCRSEMPALEQTRRLQKEMETISIPLQKNEPTILGELRGAKSPLWRGKTTSLQGNYFHTSALDSLQIEEGALLVTSGLDGLFPEGLLVGKVTSLEKQREGVPAISLVAEVAAGDLSALRVVHVLPPR